MRDEDICEFCSSDLLFVEGSPVTKPHNEMWWKTLVTVCLLVVVVDTGANPQRIGRQEPPSTNQVYNVWEYAFSHDRTGLGPRQRQATTANTAQQQNPCLWSIVLCCSASTQSARDNCFEEVGCTGAWFDTNLCSPEYISAVQRQIAQSFTSGLGKR
ncbi:hypothetical protein Hamer_G025485 [Homarus americanus]|uniref:Uncharacterized protein n=1 Tax=Homarus americanus TaxID=6706 RepID=A0A8J5MZM7_HOMAM|nr:hypothetical protein Hamer_G025485 [Homarus americanus]